MDSWTLLNLQALSFDDLCRQKRNNWRKPGNNVSKYVTKCFCFVGAEINLERVGQCHIQERVTKEFQFYPTGENKTWKVVFLENESTISVWK